MNIQIHKTAHIAPQSVIVGDVKVGEESTVLYYSVLRGDNAPISVGKGSNIQENCSLHTDPGFPISIGDGVTVGHGCVLHGCSIGSNTIIGMGSVVLNGAKIGKDCLIGAGSLVTENAVIPDGSLSFGSPAKVVGELTAEHLELIRESAEEYVQAGAELFGEYGENR